MDLNFRLDLTDFRVEPCANVIVSAAARRQFWSAAAQEIRRWRGVGGEVL